ncbi:uncharacterized protein LOC112598442 [Melanaphis sacchari]|uniref:uncharacterized protein LOC112598442 n=1 Tax=Melanaphis sacchari TaxID=742174 RepID=UPI000DC155F6|nr:uncharacterized protein LOC112598442 [Melanaphis sacchari]
MAYIQILAIVLCSCFVQDAFSATKIQKSRSAAQANGVVSQQLPGAAGEAAKMQPMKRTTTLKRIVSRKVVAPPKYPHLTAVKDKFWKSWENINQTKTGKLNTRAIRNALNDILVNDRFWWSVISAVRRRAKVTNDSQRAENKIRMCNAFTSTITSPNAVQGFQDIVNEVYGTVTSFRSDLATDALQIATDMVNTGEVTNSLDALSKIVHYVKLSPEMLKKMFAMFHKTLNMGGRINMGGGIAKSLMSITSKFNK